MAKSDQRRFLAKLKRILPRLERLQDEALEIELADHLDLEGRMNDASNAVAELIEGLQSGTIAKI